MQRDIQTLAKGKYDVLVIGGGITGACIAHDAALRGLSVALVEKNDFGAYTSSASSKLLHGGIRYLAKAQFLKVRESASEQAIFQHIAPHITRWVPFLIPTDKSTLVKGKAAMKAAMIVYSLCCKGVLQVIRDAGKRPPERKYLSASAVVNAIPMLSAVQGLTGAQVLFESHMHSSERMTLAFIKTAVSNGAQVANYLQVTGLKEENGHVVGVEARDCLTGETCTVEAKIVVNSAGPFVQEINTAIPGLRLHHTLTGFSRGIHIVTRQLEEKYAMALTTRKKTEGLITRGGRHFFIIPWRGCSLIGTTNVPHEGLLDTIRVTRKDIEDFLKDINEALPSVQLTFADVHYAFTGIYPIIAEEIKPDTYQGTGEFQIVDHGKKDGIHGIVTALGAKFTTARNVAEQCVDLVAEKLGGKIPASRTAQTQLLEGNFPAIRDCSADVVKKYASHCDERSISHLLCNYGKQLDVLIEQGAAKNMLGRVCPDRDTLEIEIDYAVREEMAVCLDDVIFRRTGLGTIGDPGDVALRRCAEIMARTFKWDEDEIARQIDTVRDRYRYE